MKTLKPFLLVAAFAAVVAFATPALADAAVAGDPTTPVTTPAAPSVTGPVVTPAVSWGAILGGAAVALTLQLLFTILGTAVGAAAIDPHDRHDMVGNVPQGALIWWLVTGLIALFVGGFVSGKLSGATTATDASMAIGGLHGLIMWSVATILTFLLLASSVGMLVGGIVRVAYNAVSLAGKGVANVASAATSVVGAAGSALGGVAEQVGGMVKDAVASQVPQLDTEKVKRGIRQLLRDTGKPELNPDKMGEAMKHGDPLSGDEELGSVLKSVYGQITGKVDAADREALVNVLMARTGKKKEDINKALEKVDQTYQEAKKAYETAVADAERKAKEVAAEAERKARDAAAATAKAVAKIAIWTFVSLVGGMIVSSAGATLGVSKPLLFYIW